MKMKYFKNVKDLKDLKKQFKKLAMEYHPDRPTGNAEIMKIVNNEYDELFPIYKNKENTFTNETAESTRNEFYTQNGWKGNKYDRNLDIKTIAKLVREQLKKEFSDCRFSVRKSEFSGGCSLDVTIKETSKNIYSDLNNNIINYQIGNAYHEELTSYGNKLITRVWEIIDQYRFSDCDGQIDYFHTNFYPSLTLGEYGETVKVVERKPKTTKKNAKTSETTVNKNHKNNFEVVENIEKHGIELYFNSIPNADFRNLLKTNGFRWNRSKRCWYTKKSDKIVNFLNGLQNEQLPA